MMRQRQDRREKSLYSKLCDADVCLGIRIRESDQVTTFLCDSTVFWSGLSSQLETHYPRPNQITSKDFDFNPTTDEEDSTAAQEFKAARTI
ncbi:hypothetical protein M752DRAFT_277153 [Aspergillus phoenicis ATCC 13157]|uniref:MADS-box domain-containing protein n=1 Tax=Aspergillus phoenicis ATCC 13157 TaxID=1353007 RepID=A0A370PFX7_ASPPH|nr:hypothetical protein M752DRAFT_277153 [Aspergillus phoenicis ATCC 13157]